MKSCDEFAWAGGLLGLILAVASAWRVSRWQPSEADLEPARRLGYSRPAATLAEQQQIREGKLSWLEAFQQAMRIQFSTADRLRVEPPLEEALVLLETDVQPAASFRLETSPESGWVLRVKPWQSEPWSAPSGSQGPVRPAVYPANGRLAYYDLRRIWISDLQGMRLQSLRHVPLLEKGGEIFWDYAGKRLCWMGIASTATAAVELGALPAPSKANRAWP